MCCIFRFMKERIYRTLNIKHSESSQVFDLLTVQFFIGLANALVSVIALTLFVYNFSIHSLPLVYLVIAGLLILINYIYEKLEHKYSPLALLKYVISFGAVLLTVLWVGLSYGNKDDFIFLLLVSSVLIYMVTGYAFWGLVSLLFNVRESRRVFSIVGSGDIPAKLIGYIAGPLFIPLLGLNNILWFAVCSFITGLILFNRFIRKKSWDSIKKKSQDVHDNHSDHEHKKESLVSFFFKNRLIFAISLVSIISYNVFILVDYTFISQVKLRFENITDLAAYIAVFFAFGRLIALGFKLIFTSRVIERLGVIYCLFITPVALFLFCLLFFFYSDNSTYNLFIFGLMAMLTEVLRSTMQEPVFFILFQPLKENLRLKGHIISKGYMYPPSLIIVGLSLLFLHKTGTEMTILMAIKVVIVNLGIWAAIIFFMRRTYLNTIHASIKKGIFSSDDIYITDNKTIDILLNKIKTGKKIEVIYALNILEKSGYAGLPGLLQNELAQAVDVEIKKYALDRLEEQGIINVAIFKDLLKKVNDAEFEQKLVYLLCKHDEAFLKEASEKLKSYAYATQKIIIINLLNQREFNYLFLAGNEINRLLYSADALERVEATEIISELKHVKFSEAIKGLINDKEIIVKRVAIVAACKLRMQALMPSLIQMLQQPALKNIVLKGMQVYGDVLFQDIKSLSLEIPRNFLADFIKIAGKFKGPDSTSFLVSILNDKEVLLKDQVLHALWLKEYEPYSSTETENFQILLNSYLKSGLNKITDYKQVPVFVDKDMVKRSIFTEIKSDLVLSLKICALLFKQKELNRILELMEIDKQEKLYNAMEMLELLLPKKISTDINLLFDFILDPQHDNHIMIEQDVTILYNKVMFDSPLLYNPWTKAVCVYCSWNNNETNFLQKLKKSDSTNYHYLLKETTNFVLQSIK